MKEIRHIARVNGYEDYVIIFCNPYDVKIYSHKKGCWKLLKGRGEHNEIELCKDGIRTHGAIHKWLYRQYFGDIPKGFDIHHIDLDPNNNNIKNLLMITHSEHISLHNKKGRAKKASAKAAEKSSKAVLQFDKNFKPIAEYKSITEASKVTGINNGTIGRVANGKRNFAGGLCGNTKMRFDCIISNPPYGRIGNEITASIVDNVDFGCFVNLLPANDYRRFHKENALWQYVDINSMKTFQPGSFKDAYVTTMACRINKERAYYISEDEFEIENYQDKSLVKYFYENRKRNYYAFDNFMAQVTFNQFSKTTVEKSFYIGYRDPKNGHLPYAADSITTRYNMNKMTKEQVIAESSKSMQDRGQVGQFSLVPFNTEIEKTNFANFVYSDNGFRFISKVLTGLSNDGYIAAGKYMPKVDWTKPQTVESILAEYGYTEDEIDEVMADLPNYKLPER